MAKIKNANYRGTVYTTDIIKEKLLNDDRWLMRGILAIYNGQTAEEQSSEATKEDNGIGFNGIDGGLLSSYAKQIKVRHSLSPLQLSIARKRMPKYAGQLLAIIEERGRG